MQTLQDVSTAWPTWSEIFEVITLSAGYNSMIVILGATLLGIAGGLMGTFTVLRRRALMSDALAHSTLPGVALSFILLVTLGYSGKNVPLLLLGAALSASLGVICVSLIVRTNRLREDAAIGIVLSVFFGVGVVLLSVVQSMGVGNEGGLQHYIYGQTATMRREDAELLALLASACLFTVSLFLKEFRLICFDQEFAKVQGWPVWLLDLLLMTCLLIITVIGLQTVGLLLITAIIVIPPTAARLWTESLNRMLVGSGVFGGISAYLGACLSALLPRLPAGAVIALTAFLIFCISFLFAPRRGLLSSLKFNLQWRFTIFSDHVLRDVFELCEQEGKQETAVSVAIDKIATLRNLHRLKRTISLRLLTLKGVCSKISDNQILISAHSWSRAKQLVKSHRLWEQYAQSVKSIDPSHVENSVDLVEHILSDKMIKDLEEAFPERIRRTGEDGTNFLRGKKEDE